MWRRSHLALLLATIGPLMTLHGPLVHMALYLCHDILRALHSNRHPPQVRYLHLLLELLRHTGLLLAALAATLAPRSQARPCGKGGVGRLLGSSLLQGVEPHIGLEVVVGALRQGGKHGAVARRPRNERPVVAEPAGRLTTPVTYHLAIVLTEV